MAILLKNYSINLILSININIYYDIKNKSGKYIKLIYLKNIFKKISIYLDLSQNYNLFINLKNIR